MDIVTNWLASNLNIEITQTSRSSGMIQRLLDDFGQQSVGVTVTVYGVSRPLLPAALMSQGVGIMRFIESWRGLGWYLLAPMLLYGAWLAVRPKLDPALYLNRSNQLRWLALAIWGWVFLASAIAGGDQWDNPRYRAMFMVFQAVFAAWTWYAVQQAGTGGFGVLLQALRAPLLWRCSPIGIPPGGPGARLHIFLVPPPFLSASPGIVVWGILVDRQSSSSSPPRYNSGVEFNV